MGCWIGTVISDGNNSDVSDDRHRDADDSDCEFLVSLSLSLITDHCMLELSSLLAAAGVSPGDRRDHN